MSRCLPDLLVDGVGHEGLADVSLEAVQVDDQAVREEAEETQTE